MRMVWVWTGFLADRMYVPPASANCDEIPQLFQLHRADPRDVDEIIDAREGTVGLPVLDDLLRQTGSYAGEKIQFRG